MKNEIVNFREFGEPTALYLRNRAGRERRGAVAMKRWFASGGRS
jgi:hypothetical protein